MKKPKPLVTIGIPTYNRADSFLRHSLGSALNQTYPNIEIIVSDNCSTDSTEAFVKNVGDERVRYNRQTSMVSPPRNADDCLDQARGEYFILLHDDDMLDADFVEACIEAVDGRDVGMVHTGAKKIDHEGKILAFRKNGHGASTTFQYFQAVLEGRAVTYFCNTLYHTEKLRAIGGFKSPAYTYQDVAANVQMACLHEKVDIEEPKASYRIHGSKLGSTMGIERWCDDFLYLIGIMSGLMPEHRSYFQGEGRRIACKRCFRKASRMTKFSDRLRARWCVYRKFECTSEPFVIFGEKLFEKVARRLEKPGLLASLK